MTKFVSLILAMLTAFAGTTSYSSGYTQQTTRMEALKNIFHKSEIISTAYTGTPSEYVWNETDEYTADYAVTIEKSADRDFVVLNLADVHFSDYGYRFFTNIIGEYLVRSLVDTVKPDLILVSGDEVCDDSSYYSIRHFTDMMESFETPWAPIFGNHDREGNCDEDYLAEVMMSGKYCIMQKGDARMGCGNYVINITENGKIVETIVMTDSHGNTQNELQGKWYEWVCEGTKKLSADAEITAFMHIPLPEYETAYNLAINSENNEYKLFGECNEKICCARNEDGTPANGGFFESVKAGGTSYVFCSHDHMNDFSLEYEGVRLTYCMKLGYASGYQPGFNGGTVITIGHEGITKFEHLTKSLGGFKVLEHFDA